jgi:hypothetical protein
MCDPITIAIVGAVGGLAMQAMQKQPSMPEPPKPVKPPQTKMPSGQPQGGGEQMQQGMGPSNASTLLTGAGGVSPASLLLGRNDLLGK